VTLLHFPSINYFSYPPREFRSCPCSPVRIRCFPPTFPLGAFRRCFQQSPLLSDQPVSLSVSPQPFSHRSFHRQAIPMPRIGLLLFSLSNRLRTLSPLTIRSLIVVSGMALVWLQSSESSFDRVFFFCCPWNRSAISPLAPFRGLEFLRCSRQAVITTGPPSFLAAHSNSHVKGQTPPPAFVQEILRLFTWTTFLSIFAQQTS